MTPLDKKLANAKRQRARERAQAPDAATIAADIDLATVAGHNLRALLLRLLDDEPGQGFFNIRANAYSPDGLRIDIAVGDLVTLDRGARMGGFVVLTPLGREVAERLRPVPWTSPGSNYGWLVGPDGETVGQLDRADIAERIAAALTREDLEAAKRYKVPA
jgi:hypothetical protein